MDSEVDVRLLEGHRRTERSVTTLVRSKDRNAQFQWFRILYEEKPRQDLDTLGLRVDVRPPRRLRTFIELGLIAAVPVQFMALHPEAGRSLGAKREYALRFGSDVLTGSVPFRGGCEVPRFRGAADEIPRTQKYIY